MKIEQFAVPNIKTVATASQKAKESFSDVLKNSVEKVNNLQKEADAAIDDLALGDNKDVVQTIIAMEKADISFRLMMQVRNKIVQAYEEVMRMQV